MRERVSSAEKEARVSKIHLYNQEEERERQVSTLMPFT